MTRYLVTEPDGHCYGYASPDSALQNAGADANILATDDGATTRPLTDIEAIVRTTRRRPGSRYDYDFTLCCEWAQMDTEADAPWFGQWANPFTRTVITFAEGDETTTRCADDERFAAELRRIAAWHDEHNRWKGIDAWNDPLAAQFASAGAGDLLRPAIRRS
ncbi:MAG: hypothetical protein OXI15_02115 [Chromatiales bacterium]|nr:hypothetical protein [Chromatiales bacterium]